MRVTIYQPRYFPQLHYFQRMLSVDTFVFLDNAQYTKSLKHKTSTGWERNTSYQSDTPVKIANGEFLLTIPIKHEGILPINKTHADYSHKWTTKHLSILHASYQYADNFKEIFTQVTSLLEKKCNSLAEMNIATTLWGLSVLLEVSDNYSDTSISLEFINRTLLQTKKQVRLKKIIPASTLGVARPEGNQQGTAWTVAICKNLGANEYVHGKTAEESYMDHDYYSKHNIKTIPQEWSPPIYKQQFMKHVPFIKNLSVLDLLFNTKRKQSQQILGIF